MLPRKTEQSQGARFKSCLCHSASLWPWGAVCQGCWNKPSQILWLKATQMHHGTVLEVMLLKRVDRAVFLLEASGENPLPCFSRSARRSLSSLTCALHHPDPYCYWHILLLGLSGFPLPLIRTTVILLGPLDIPGWSPHLRILNFIAPTYVPFGLQPLTGPGD